MYIYIYNIYYIYLFQGGMWPNSGNYSDQSGTCNIEKTEYTMLQLTYTNVQDHTIYTNVIYSFE